MIQREREAGETGTICLKRLDLITPNYATHFGLVVDKPVFTSPNDSEPLIYQVGDTNKVAGFFEPLDTGSGLAVEQTRTEQLGGVEIVFGRVTPRPRVGIGYEEISTLAMVYGNNHWSELKRANWVAVVEPMGRVSTEEDAALPFNRVTDELKVKEMLAFCEWCRREPLKEGLVLDLFGSGYLFAVCTDRHYKSTIGKLVELSRAKPDRLSPFYFKIEQSGEVVFK